MEKVRVEEKNVMLFYEELGSSHFKLQGTTLEKYGKLKLDIYFRSIDFAATITGVIGIIAGFGFTAFSSIESKPLFFLGEAILFYGIFKGLIWVQRIYQSEYKGLEDESKKHLVHYKIRNEAFTKVYNQLIAPGHEINKADLESLQKIDQDSLILFKPNDEERPPQTIYSKEIYGCLLAGAILLFSSFFIVDLIKFFCIK